MLLGQVMKTNQACLSLPLLSVNLPWTKRVMIYALKFVNPKERRIREVEGDLAFKNSKEEEKKIKAVSIWVWVWHVRWAERRT